MQFTAVNTTSNLVTRLQFYNYPPYEKITIDELENLAIERLKVLKIVETVGQDYLKGSKEYDDRLRNELAKIGQFGKIFTSTGCQTKFVNEDIRRDKLSHFILQISYCRSEDIKRWFIQQETDLFRFRFLNEKFSNPRWESCIEQFLVQNELLFVHLPDSEKQEFRNELISSNFYPNFNFDTTNYYKVFFTQVPDLIRARKVFIKDGYAYVPDFELVTLVTTRFRIELSHNLSRLSLTLMSTLVNEETRILPLLSGLAQRYIGTEYKTDNKNSDEVITADKVDELARDPGLFPPCMATLHESVRSNKHLRHHGRRQYGLFLKGIGLNLEESLKFWRGAFTPKTDADTFAKQYAYNIRHMYGKEGKRVDQNPFSCVAIIMGSAPASGEFHGCPFRHMDLELLKQKLSSSAGNKIFSQESINSIIQKAKERQYHLSCREYFKVANKLNSEDASGIVISHPNQYFDQAMSLRKIDRKLKPSTSVCRVPAHPLQSHTIKEPSFMDVEDDSIFADLTV